MGLDAKLLPIAQFITSAIINKCKNILVNIFDRFRNDIYCTNKIYTFVRQSLLLLYTLIRHQHHTAYTLIHIALISNTLFKMKNLITEH